MRRLLLIGLVAGLTGCTNQLPFQEPAAAVVDGHGISMKAYEARLEVSRHRDPLAGLTTSQSSPPPTQRLEDFTIQQLIREEIIRQAAERRKIQISDSQVDSRIARLRGQAGSTAFDAALGRNGFTPARFRDYQRAFLTEVAVVHAMAHERAASAEVALGHGASFIAGVAVERRHWDPVSRRRCRLVETDRPA